MDRVPSASYGAIVKVAMLFLSSNATLSRERRKRHPGADPLSTDTVPPIALRGSSRGEPSPVPPTRATCRVDAVGLSNTAQIFRAMPVRFRDRDSNDTVVVRRVTAPPRSGST